PGQRARLERMLAPAGERTGLFPATAVQRQLWLAAQLNPESSTYHMPIALHVRGALDLDRLDRALADLVRRHEALRTTLESSGMQVVQRIRAEVPTALHRIDAAGSSLADLLPAVNEAAHEPFLLSTGPLMRCTSWTLGPLDHVVLFVVHHAVADGASLQLLFDELADGYLGQMPAAVNAPHLADVAVAEANRDTGPAVGYWSSRLDGYAELQLPTPTDRASSGCGEMSVPLDRAMSAALADVARAEATTVYALQVAALSAVISRNSGSHDVAIGVPFALRDTATSSTVGPLVNTLPVRLGVQDGDSFGDLLRRAGTAVADGWQHVHAPLDEVARERSALAAGGLLQVVLAADLQALRLPTLGDLLLTELPIEVRSAKFPLVVDVGPESVRVQYAADKIDAAFARSIAHGVRSVLSGAVSGTSARIGELDVLGPELAAEESARCYGPTCPSVLGSEGLGDVVSAVAAADPDRTALVDGNTSVSYGDLLRRADTLGGELQRAGAGADRPVAVLLPRGVDHIVACVAAVRVGAPYVPIDPAYPSSRISFLIHDCGAAVVLTAAENAGLATGSGAAEILLRDGAADGPACEPVQMRVDDAAMIIYTSGSTGRPKGIEISHGGIARLIDDRRFLTYDSSRVYLCISSVSFDASTWEMWSALLTGARLVIAPEHSYRPRDLGRLIAENGVTTALLTTQLFNTVVDEDPMALAPLAELVVGGEALSASHVRRAQSALPGTRLINAYGPAEGSVITTMFALDEPLGPEETTVPIGSPLANTDVWVVDEWLRPVPPGVLGQIGIG
ncbi:MAG: AMP-binding protein, partial [Mycobacteriales bacterium]